jgi:hypothetical protein
MSRVPNVSPLEPHTRERGELVRLVRRIQNLTLEVHDLRQGEEGTAELDAKERRLEQLRWRLAALARRTATDGLDAAA